MLNTFALAIGSIMATSKTQLLSYPYSVSGLCTYTSAEWLAEQQKQYRKVFEVAETTYVYAEIKIENKLYGVADWSSNVRIQAAKILNRAGATELLCELKLKLVVFKWQKEIILREGWGHKEKGFYWKQGDYKWEVYLDNHSVASTRFYLEDEGPVSPEYNPYFEIESARLFEGPIELVEAYKRTYYTRFAAHEARHVWLELTFENLVSNSWFCELSFFFRKDSGELKGKTSELRQVKQEEDEVTIVTGWGADTPGTWHSGNYFIDVVFMGKRVASIPFSCGEVATEGTTKYFEADELQLLQPDEQQSEQDSETLAEVMQQLDRLIGLEDVKKKVSNYTQYLSFIKLRKNQGFTEKQPIALHSAFKGNPGTGKTTVAKLLGRIYHKLGFLKTGKVVEVGRAELIGQYIGQTAPKVKELIESARGGVLFIDEAYSLVRTESDEKDYGHEVIEVLVKEISDGPGDIAIFLAGYPKELEVLLNSNPGLKSRIRLNFHFPDYAPDELLQIAQHAAQQQEVQLTPNAAKFLLRQLTDHYRERNASFGNARYVHQLIEDAKLQLGLRIMAQSQPDKTSKQRLANINQADIQQALQKKVAPSLQFLIDAAALDEAIAELEQLVGLEQIKHEISELVSLVSYYKSSGLPVLNRLSLHSVFKGNPGTGKTTVARLMARIYKALGLLERGHLIECTRDALVAGYVGQTAIKTREIIAKAAGGLLFIDEAYTLGTTKGEQDFGREAVEVLLKEMEDNHGSFAVVVAGYTEPMNRFLEVNPGLKSRFDRNFTFPDLTQEQLLQALLLKLKKVDLQADAAATAHLKKFVYWLHQNRDAHFGNARQMQKVAQKAIRNQHLRMAKLPLHKHTKTLRTALTLPDVAEFVPGYAEFITRPSIGFTS